MGRQGGSSGNYLRSAVGTLPITSYPFSCAITAKSPTLGGIAFLLGFTAGSEYNGIYVEEDFLVFLLNDAETIATSISSTTLYTFVFVATSNTSKIAYVNGSATSPYTSSLTFPTGLTRWSVGAVAHDGSLGANGWEFHHAAFWNAALTQADATSLMSIPPTMIRPHNLKMYAPLNDGAGDARDIYGGQTLLETGTMNLIDDVSIGYANNRRRIMVGKPSSGEAESILYNSVFAGCGF